MKKYLFPILILLLLFSATASASQPSVTTAPVPVNQEETEARIYADEMEERFCVRILFGEDCLNIINIDEYTITVGEPAGSPLQAMIGFSMTATLKNLENALIPYPTGLFTRIRDEYAPNGIRILIADRINPSNPELIVTGFVICEDGYYNIILGRNRFEQSVFHHEMWHAMEMFITSKNPDAFQSWDSLNPPDFQYIRDYTAHIKDYPADYFVRGCGAVNAGEDRATIAEAAFWENRNEWFAEHPAIKNKLNAMNEALKGTLLLQYSIQSEN